MFRNTHAFWHDRIKQAPEFGEIMRAQVGARLDWFERELGNRQYIAGDRFTVADITALCAIDFAKVSKIRLDPATQPNLSPGMMPPDDARRGLVRSPAQSTRAAPGSSPLIAIPM